MGYQLVMKTGTAPGKIYLLEKNEYGIGREVGNEVFVNEAEVSRRHARLTLQTGNYLLEDLGSTNGTFVNGQRLMGPRLLQPGDTILLGENVSLTFELAPFDPNAAMAGAPAPEEVPGIEPVLQPEPQPAMPEVLIPPPPPEPPLQSPPPSQAAPAHVGDVYAGTAYSSPPQPRHIEPLASEEGRSASRPWLWVGCGCLMLLLVALGALVFAVDYFNLWCSLPLFEDITVFLGGQC
jgi:FHA domain